MVNKTVDELFNDYDIINFLKNFYDSGNSETEEGRTFIRHYHFHLAEALIKDFGEDNAKKVAKIMLSFLEN